MKNTATLLCATLLCVSAALAFGSAAIANDIYKYTDEDGTVHYVDRPTNAPSEERVQIASSRSSQRAAPEPAADAPDWRERRAARQEDRASAAAAKSEADERSRLCQQQKERLVEYRDASRLYRMDEQGERVYLDEAEIEEARQQVRKQIEQHCND